MKLLWRVILVLFVLLLVNGAFIPDRDHRQPPLTPTSHECAVHC